MLSKPWCPGLAPVPFICLLWLGGVIHATLLHHSGLENKDTDTFWAMMYDVMFLWLFWFYFSHIFHLDAVILAVQVMLL